MAKYLDDNGLLYFWQQIKTKFATAEDVPQPSTIAPKMDGTATVGTSNNYARADHIHPSDTSKVDAEAGKGLSTNDFTNALKTKLEGVEEGAEVNQNAFSNVKVGATTIAADTSTDTLELIAGSGITLTPNATADSIEIESEGTTYTGVSPIDVTGSAISHETSGVTAGTYGSTTGQTPAFGATANVPYVTVDAKGHVSSAGTATVTMPNSLASGTANGLMSSADKTKLDGIEEGAEVNTITGVKGDKETTYRTGNVNITPSNIGAIPTDEKGVANGVATLGSDGLVPTAQLPSYVDDVIDAYPRAGVTELSASWLSATQGGAALTPEKGKIYILLADSTTYSANTQFRWSGSTYVKLSDGSISAITNAEIDTILAS